ncbi:MAG TPA: hypothetical protein VF885_11930 [Arthrobacter sp.]
MTSTLTHYAKAAQHLRMAWLTQSEFPAQAIVEDAFRDAIDELPGSTTYEDTLVRSALQTIVDGVDPRGGSYRAQAIYAAAQLHDRVAALALESKVKKPKVREGSVIHGYAGGVFGESYWHRLVTKKGDGWINYEILDGPDLGQVRRHHGNLKELVEYLVPDHHCPDDCPYGQD